MKLKIHVFRLFFLCIAFILRQGEVNAQSFTWLDVSPLHGKYAFSHTQTPDNLVPMYPSVTANSYEWEQSLNPLSGFTTISGAVSASYTFPAPLSQTTYFRRKANLTGGAVYSNVVKIEVVSIHWEDLNYIREHDVLVPGMSDWKTIDNLPIGQKLQTTTYLDGVGRPIQKISRETATPDPAQPNLWGDIVQFSRFDALGREPKRYLPYTTKTEPGKYKTTPLTEQPQYYTNLYNESSAYSNTTFDNSPLNRVANIKSPGTSWAAGIGNSALYDLNDAADNVQMFAIGYSTGDIPVKIGVYPAKSLFKTEQTDENGKKVIEYTNISGQSILTKVQLDDNPSAAHSGWICTYSVYDDFGLLRYRFQPEAVKWLDANGWSFAVANGPTVLEELCFRYEYDDKGRNILKKAPGAKKLYLLYDQRDRVVFMQDGNQRAKTLDEWTANLYDDLDRPVITTLYHTNKTVSQLQTDINNAAAASTVSVTTSGTAITDLIVDQRVSTIPLYTAQNSIEFVNGFESVPNDEFLAEIDPSATSGPLTVTTYTHKNPITSSDLNNSSVTTIVKYFFYDNYTFGTVRPFHTGFDNGLAHSTGDPIVTSKRTTSMVTGTRVRVLGTSTFLSTTIYYDEIGRPIQNIEDNLKNGTDITTLQYQFDGRLLSSNTKHTTAGSGYAAFSTVTKNSFDKIGRIAGLEKKYGSNNFKAISSYEYDDVGRLKRKRLDPGYTGSGKSELESLDYSYNIHNEITGINKDYALKTPGKYAKWGNFFGLYLGYDNRDGVFTSANLMGQVTGTLWTTQGDDAQRRYDFSYDNAGRLIKALFQEKEKPADSWSNAKMDFSVTGRNGKIEYDLNGNLLYMLQKGVTPGSPTPKTVDDLEYTYSTFSNKLTRVSDNGNLSTANGKLGDFADGANVGDDYVYDDNGNLVIDLNKNAKDLSGVGGSNGITYNFLDKPEEIRILGKGTIKIVYDADGNKLQKLFTPEGSSTVTITTYIHQFVYKETSPPSGGVGGGLQYINFEEGRIRIMQAVSQNNGYDQLTMNGNMDLPSGNRGAYDYFIRDYLGNVRMILTEETHLGSNACTMETNRAANEEPVFGRVDANGAPTAGNEVQARFATSGIPGQASGNGWQNSTIGNHVVRIGNLAGSKIGPNTILKVMAGDQVSASTIYYYQNPVVNGTGAPSLLADVLLSLGQAISGSNVVGGLTKSAAANITSQLNGAPFSTLTDPHSNDGSGDNPKAYLSVAFFDERFNYVSEGSVSARVIQAGNGAPALVLANIKAPKNGYAYVYVSNSSDEMVYFDNLQVSNNHGHIIEENHYYAYGLKIAGLSSAKLSDPNEGHIGNKNLYNDKELIDDADLGWYDYGFRYYDPQIGRFPQLDPLADIYYFYTPYQFAGNDPIANIDVDGLEPARVLQFAKQTGGIVTTSNGKWAVQYFTKGGITSRIFKSVTAASSALKTAAQISIKALDIATDFVPIVGGAKDIYKGIRDGDGWQIALGIGSIAMDIFSFGGFSVAKGAVKTAAKQTAKVFGKVEAKQVAIKSADELGTTAFKFEFKKEGKIVLGHVDDGIAKKAVEVGGKYFKIPQEFYSTAANQKFLDRLIARGDKVILTRSVLEVDHGRVLGWEIKYLLDRNYEFIDNFTMVLKK